MPFSRALTAAAAVLALALTGCSSTERSGDPQGFNDADVEFATEMIQHHAQALVMVDLTMGRDLDPGVTEIAEEIRAAQTPEIEKMADWLEEWDEPVPETSRDHANAHAEGHGGAPADADMPGMMSAEEMDALENASGEAFETMWLKMMIEHHEGAVEMAQQEVQEGQNGKAISLAEDIIEAQQEEISTMQQLLEG